LEREDLLKVDFHTLRVLVTVHQYSSIRKAADSLDMSQSSISYLIDRLRSVFNDELFVRLGRGITATRRCETIVEGAKSLITQLDELASVAEFEPASTTEHFVLSCNFYERSIFLPPLTHRLSALAPHVKLSVVTVGGHGLQLLESGNCDVVISPLQGETGGLYCKRLMAESYACFVSDGSRWAKEPLTMESYMDAKHIIARPAPEWKPHFLATLDAMGVSIRPQIEVSGFGAIDRVVEDTDLVLTASEGFSRIFSPRIKSVAAPFECEFPFYMTWHGRTHASPAHRWFRNQISETAQVLKSTFGASKKAG
jgi:DNA-binding transcriptional LysR family regulator